MVKGEDMVIEGTCANISRGRLTDKARNLKRFAEQWAEFEDEESIEFGEDDAEYVREALHLGDRGLGRYHEMADALKV